MFINVINHLWCYHLQLALWNTVQGLGDWCIMLLAKIVRLTPIRMIDSYIFGFLLSKINVNLFITSGPITVPIRLKKAQESCLYIDPSVPVRGPWLSMVKLEKILKLRLKNWFVNLLLKFKTSTSSSSIELFYESRLWPPNSL